MIRLALDGQDLGEFSEAELRALCQAGDLTGLSVFFWREGMADWQPLDSITYLEPAEPRISAELTDEFHKQRIAVIETRLKALKRFPRVFSDEIDNAKDELQDAKADRQNRKEERDGDVQWWVNKFSKESIEEFLSEDVEPFLMVFKKPTKAQITAMVAHCERELGEGLTDDAGKFFALYEKLFPDARKSTAHRASPILEAAQAGKASGPKKKKGCLPLVVITFFFLLLFVCLSFAANDQALQCKHSSACFATHRHCPALNAARLPTCNSKNALQSPTAQNAAR